MISENCMTLVHPRAFSERDPLLLHIHLVIHLASAAVVQVGQVLEHLMPVEAVVVPIVVAAAVPFVVVDSLAVFLPLYSVVAFLFAVEEVDSLSLVDSFDPLYLDSAAQIDFAVQIDYSLAASLQEVDSFVEELPSVVDPLASVVVPLAFVDQEEHRASLH